MVEGIAVALILESIFDHHLLSNSDGLIGNDVGFAENAAGFKLADGEGRLLVKRCCRHSFGQRARAGGQFAANGRIDGCFCFLGCLFFYTHERIAGLWGKLVLVIEDRFDAVFRPFAGDVGRFAVAIGRAYHHLEVLIVGIQVLEDFCNGSTWLTAFDQQLELPRGFARPDGVFAAIFLATSWAQPRDV